MPFIIEILTIILLSIFQSVFGVGLLLFGTPLFLYFGYGFSETLSSLLPASITISFIQFFYSKDKDLIYIKDFNFFCLPFLGVFLYYAVYYETIIDFKFWISIILIISSLITFNNKKFYFLSDLILRLRKLVLIFIGIIHGLSNMGGGFLSIFSSSMSGNNKLLTRQYISYGYLSMGIIQYLILAIFYTSNLSFSKFFYIFLAIIVYFPSQSIFNFVIYDIYVKIISIVAMLFGMSILLPYYLYN